MAIWDNLDLKFLKKYGQTPSQQLRHKIKTLSVRQSAQLFKETFNLKPSVEQIIAEISQLAMAEYEENPQLKPFALELLTYLHDKGTKMCIATAAARSNVETALKKLDVIKYFQFIMAAEDTATGKESPQIFLECCKKMGAEPREVTVFEDSLYAIKTAKKAGFFVIGVYDSASLDDTAEIQSICDLYINDFGEILVKMEVI